MFALLYSMAWALLRLAKAHFAFNIIIRTGVSIQEPLVLVEITNAVNQSALKIASKFDVIVINVISVACNYNKFNATKLLHKINNVVTFNVMEHDHRIVTEKTWLGS